jgi:hypothetical protein
MRKSFGKRALSGLASAVIALTAVVGIQVVTTQSASAAVPCISADNARVWYVNASASSANSKSPTYTTTANCRDINFGQGESEDGGDAVGRVRVCFVSAGTCQSSWKSYNAATQFSIVVATNVLDGTTFKMEFDWGSGADSDRFGFGIWA